MDTAQVADLARPLATASSLELYDVEQLGNTLRVSLSGIDGTAPDVSALEDLSRSLSLALDEAELGGGSYVLEVSSPGVERKLRTPAHFNGAVGETVTVTRRTPEGRQRLFGELVSFGDGVLVVDDAEHGAVDVTLDTVDKAKTIFEWGPRPKPGSGKSSKKSSTRNKAGS